MSLQEEGHYVVVLSNAPLVRSFERKRRAILLWRPLLCSLQFGWPACRTGFEPLR